jgi:23S rRNA (uracil1939-C5)-methyltransferase
MALGTLFTARIEGLVAGGAGLARYEGGCVFVEDTCPGDRIVGCIREEHRGWARADALEITEASAARTRPVCPFYGECGGCSLQHVAYETQLGEKKRILGDAFTRIGGLAAAPEIAVRYAAPFAYRNRVQVHQRPDKRLGFKARRSDAIIEVTDCPVADPLIQRALAGQCLTPPPHKGRFTVYGRSGDAPSSGLSAEALSSAAPCLTPPCSLGGPSAEAPSSGRRGVLLCEGGQSRGAVPVLDRTVLMDAGLFFQSNAVMLEALITDLIALSDEADASLPAADIYAGVGTFAAFLRDRFPVMDVVEQNKAALSLARENTTGAARKNHAVQFFAQSADDWAVSRSALRYGFVVVDPPRQGLSPRVRARLAAAKVPTLAYVSCNPATLARDSRDFIAAGYTLSSLTLYDFYPQTAHIESLAVFNA